MPSMDLSGIQGTIPTWLQWIIDNKDLILGILGGITAGVMGIKLGLSGMKSLGIGMMVTGIIMLIQDLLKYLNDPSWENFGKIISDIGLIIAGFGLLIGNVPVIVAGAIAIIVGLVISNWDKIKGILQTGIDWIDSKIDWIRENFGSVGVYIAELFKGVINIVLDVFDGLFQGVKDIFDGILMIFKGDFKNGFLSIGKGILNAIIGIINGFVSAINAVFYPIRALIVEAGKILGKNWTMSNIVIPKIPLLATGGIVNNPGRGVPIGGAIAGEAGAEGVIPLTDSQAMETLGEAIGRYITINANITNSMNGRVISRQLKKIQANKDFAYNT